MTLRLQDLPKSVARSGTRVPCAIPVTLRNLATAIASPAVVVLVNPQGCAARYDGPIEVGTVVHIECLPSNRSVTATVVNCIHLGEHEKRWLLGLSLTEPGNVWGITDVPADWAQHGVAED